MITLTQAPCKDAYDTTINIIGGLKDISLIQNAFNAYFNPEDSLSNAINRRNEFHLPTDKSKSRIITAINAGFLQFKNNEHQNLIRHICLSNISNYDLNFVLFWQFAINNRLFRDISINVFNPIYFSGKLRLTKDDVVAYLHDILYDSGKKYNWSDKTIDTLGSKYVNIVSKLGFLSSGTKKMFMTINPSPELTLLFLYFAKIYDSTTNDILKNELLPLLFMKGDDLMNRLIKLSKKKLLNMTYDGNMLNIELIHPVEVICNVIY